MAKFIQNLDGFVWVTQGRADPITGEIAQTRYAVNLLSGERLNVRQAQTRQHGGVPYEKRAPARQPAAPTPAGQPAAPTRKEYKLRALRPQAAADLRDFIANKAAQGQAMTEREARQSSDWKRVVRGLKSKSNRPTGAKAKALVALGRRAPEWDWSIGETPSEEEEVA